MFFKTPVPVMLVFYIIRMIFVLLLYITSVTSLLYNCWSVKAYLGGQKGDNLMKPGQDYAVCGTESQTLACELF
jgi:Na+/alanine symporter